MRFSISLLFVALLCSGVLAQVQIARTTPSNIEVIDDVIFADNDGDNLSLDLYLPPERSAGMPAVIVIREGGWEHGDNQLAGPVAAAMAQRGFVAASIEYRGASEAVLPAAVHDTKAAIRWLRANAATYDINPDAIGAMGGSWGALLAVYAGVTNDVAELEGSGGTAATSSQLSAVVGFSTPTRLADFPEAMERYVGEPLASNPAKWELLSPVTHVGSNSPPLLLIAGQKDDTVPYTQSSVLAAAYGTAGVDVELVLLPGAPHTFWYFPDLFDFAMDRTAAFFHRHLD